MSQPAMDGRVAGADVADVGFEMLHVDGVEAGDGRVEADVGFGEAGAEIVWCRGGGCGLQVAFDAVEGGEEWGEGLFVGFLGAVRELGGLYR
jgi:hypothetical protein